MKSFLLLFRKQNKKTLPIALVLAMLASLLSPITAIADETTPPEPTNIVIDESTPQPDSTPDEDASLTTPTPDSASATSTNEEPVDIALILSELPPQTDILVQVDEEIQPLATQSAQTALVIGDPIWCPDGVPPIANTGGCTDSYTTLFLLIDDIDNGTISEPNQDGIIWILDGADASGTEVVIDGSVFTTWQNYELTIQGGWDNGSTGNIIGTSVFSVPISVINWQNTVTINQIEIDGTTQTGLVVETTGDINIDGLTSSNNSLAGAELTSSGSVSITGLNYLSGNTGDGLYIQADGDIDANSIDASDNGGFGAQLISLGGVTLTGTNVLNDNTSSGLYVEAANDIDLADINADGNDANGANLNSSAGSISITGTNVFTNNNDSGLYAQAFIDIDLENITADSNGAGGVLGNGAELYAQGDFSITGINDFNDNNDAGLYAESGGSIEAENITSDGNGGSGAEFNSATYTSLAGTNVFTNNSGTGLYIEAIGDIDLENITADANGINGAELLSGDTLTLIGLNSFSDNTTASGLYTEVVTGFEAENITANDNGASGAEIYSQSTAILTGTNVFNGNVGVGLYVSATNNIDIENINAESNGTSGAELNSTAAVDVSGTNNFLDNNTTGLYVDATGNVTAENITADGNGVGAVSGNGFEVYTQGDFTLTGLNIFTNNLNSGLYVESTGTATVENISASDNNSSGAEIIATGIVSVTGANIFDNNVDTGLYIESGSNITAENLSADGNGQNGAALYSLGSISLTGTNLFTANQDTGLYLEATGNINAENITGNNNGAGGVYGSGAEFYSLSNVFLTGINAFNNNFSSGLIASGITGVSIEYTDAAGNGSSGIFIETTGDADVLCGVLSGNAGYQLEADLLGTITLTGVNFGGDIDNDLGVDEDRLVLVSNSCFTYPVIPDDGGDGGNTPEINYPPISNLPVAVQSGVNSQVVPLNCSTYKGTILTLINGDGAYIPCPIIDSARLVEVPSSAIKEMPENMEFASAFILDIYQDGKIVDLQNQSGLIDFSGVDTPFGTTFTYVYWNGFEWVEVTDQTYPFMTVFFVIPKDTLPENLAILYWDGLKWVELVDGLQLTNGRAVGQGGHFDETLRFSATVNFTGTFVLVKK